MDKKDKIKTILVLGANGMLGNAIYRFLKTNPNFKIVGTDTIYKGSDLFFLVDKEFQSNIQEIIVNIKPNYILNCIGIIRPEESSDAIYDTFFINSYFPRILSSICKRENVRMIHFSTDCVFSGLKGGYDEKDIPDETSIYGISKFLGEVRDSPNLTIRTSIIGKELKGRKNLLDWFLSQEGNIVNGFSNVLWNGVTTLTLAKIVNRIINEELLLDKELIQIGLEPINKFDLLKKIQKVYNINCVIKSVKNPVSNKTIVPSKEQAIFSNIILSIDQQIKDLKNFYNEKK